MIFDEKQKQEILKRIALTGAATVENAVENQIIANRNQISQIAGTSSGTMQINSSRVKKFDLILQRPAILKPLEAGEIRCCMCGKVASYPVWYSHIQYAINNIHFFVCFNPASPLKVTTKCYRRI